MKKKYFRIDKNGELIRVDREETEEPNCEIPIFKAPGEDGEQDGIEGASSKNKEPEAGDER